MGQKRYKTEEIIGKLRQAEVLLSQGQNVGRCVEPWGFQIRLTIDGATNMVG